jgi:hypothetical protein
MSGSGSKDYFSDDPCLKGLIFGVCIAGLINAYFKKKNKLMHFMASMYSPFYYGLYTVFIDIGDEEDNKSCSCCHCK